MVVFLNLDEDDLSDPDPHADPIGSAGFESALRKRATRAHDVSAHAVDSHLDGEIRVNPNVNGLSAALGCYPYSGQYRCFGTM